MLTTKQVRGLFFDFWWIGALFLLLVVIALVIWAYWGDPVKEEQEHKANVEAANAQNAIVGNLVANQQKVVKDAEENANRAANELANAINRDSSQHDGNRASERFCKHFPNDSRCVRQ